MRILLIVHGLPPACAGGTETYTLGLARALAARQGFQVGILARDADASLPELHIRTERRGDVDIWFVNNTFQACATFEETYRNPGLCAAVRPCVDAFAPDVVHVQHLTALSTDLVSALNSRGIPVVMTLNDYWPICHRGQLLNTRGERCDGGAGRPCADCIPAGAVAPPAAWRLVRQFRRGGSIVRWMSAAAVRLRPAVSTAPMARARAAHMREMLGHASVLLAPSKTLQAQYEAFGIDTGRILRWEQGIAQRAQQTVTRAGTVPLRVLFAGSLMFSKHPALLLDALQFLPAKSVQVDLLGSVVAYHGDEAYASSLRARLGHPAMRRSGPVPHERVAAALRDVDAVVVPSIWIENAPFVIKEAFAAGVPVIASRLGGMMELVRDGVDGLLFQPGDARSLADVFRRLSNEPALLPALRRGIRAPLTIEEDAARTAALYLSLAPHTRTSPGGAAARRRVEGSSTWNIAAVVLNYQTPDDTYIAVRSIDTSRYPADAIVVDNGSGDADALRRMLPRAEIIATERNLGFSGGSNVGIRGALERGADAVLLLNSDAILHPDALGLLVDALRDHPRAGVAAPVLCPANEPGLISSAGITYHLTSGRMRHRAVGQRRSALGTRPVIEVDAASGCALLVRREVFERCGLLDEPYFFSFEDVEFCVRARAAGFATVLVSAATVFHSGSESIGVRSPRRVYYAVRNHLRLAQQVAPRSALPRLARSAAILGYNAAYVMTSPDVSLVQGAAAFTRGSLDYVRGRFGS